MQFSKVIKLHMQMHHFHDMHELMKDVEEPNEESCESSRK